MRFWWWKGKASESFCLSWSSQWHCCLTQVSSVSVNCHPTFASRSQLWKPQGRAAAKLDEGSEMWVETSGVTLKIFQKNKSSWNPSWIHNKPKLVLVESTCFSSEGLVASFLQNHQSFLDIEVMKEQRWPWLLYDEPSIHSCQKQQ